MASWKELILSGSSAHLHTITASNDVPLVAPNITPTIYIKASSSLATFDENGQLTKGGPSFIGELLDQNKDSIVSSAAKAPTTRLRYFASGSGSSLSVDSINLTDKQNAMVDVVCNYTGSSYVFRTRFIDTGSMYYNTGSLHSGDLVTYHVNVYNNESSTMLIMGEADDVFPDTFGQIYLDGYQMMSFKVWMGDYYSVTGGNTYVYKKAMYWLPYGQTLELL